MNQFFLIVFCAIFIFRGYFTNNFVCGTVDIITIPIKNTPRYIFSVVFTNGKVSSHGGFWYRSLVV